jgi:hypothetical protein
MRHDPGNDAFDGGPLLDEYGIQRKKRGCGCGGVPAIVGYKVCSHPQMVASKTPGEDACELRCAFFMAKKAGAVSDALNGSD